MYKRLKAVAVVLTALSVFTLAAPALGQEPIQRNPDTARNRQLLSDTFGAMHYLTIICSGVMEQSWRDRMAELLAVEQLPARERDNLIAAFNHGYRQEQIYYPDCTPQTVGTINAQKRLKAEQGRFLATALADPYLH